MDKEYRSFEFAADDGLRLAGRDYGRDTGDRTPVVCLAGLSRNGRDFHPLAQRLVDQGRRVITLDYRGRGMSAWDENKSNYNIIREAKDVVNALDFVAIGRAVFIGTSRGGLILHILGAIAPGRIAAMVFNDIGPVIESDGLRNIRDYLSIGRQFSGFLDAATHLQLIHGAAFTALADSDWLDMAKAIYRDIDGPVVADFDPALTEPLKEMDFSQPLPDMWPQFDSLGSIPLLVIRGENSTLLSEKTVSEMALRHPDIRVLIADGQGHAPLLHLPAVFDEIAAFLANR